MFWWVEFFFSFSFEVVVLILACSQMDVSMPFMGGMEATELIRAFEQHDNLERTPIIALTAHAST